MCLQNNTQVCIASPRQKGLYSKFHQYIIGSTVSFSTGQDSRIRHHSKSMILISPGWPGILGMYQIPSLPSNSNKSFDPAVNGNLHWDIPNLTASLLSIPERALIWFHLSFLTAAALWSPLNISLIIASFLTIFGSYIP